MTAVPLVSVIMPVANGERFVGASVASVLTQDVHDLELIVIDDASTDATPSILAGYTDPRLRVIRNECRLGAAGARNRGIDAASAELIAFCDGDDLWACDRLAQQLALRGRAQDVAIVCSRYVEIDASGMLTERSGGHDGPDATILPALLFANVFGTSTMLVARNLLTSDRFDQALTPVEDYHLWVRLARRGKAQQIPTALVHYRRHSAGITTTLGDRAEAGLREIARLQLAWLGLHPNDDELRLHRAFGCWELEGTVDFLRRADAWLARIWSANRQVRVYVPEALRDVLTSHWLRACNAVCSGGSWDAWPTIGRSRMMRLVLGRQSLAAAAGLPWRTARGLVRRRWPVVGGTARARTAKLKGQP